MKILLLSDWMSNSGGAETYILSLRESLREQGDDVRLVACGPDIRSTAVDLPAFGTDFVSAQALMQISNPFAASRVRRIVSDFQPDAAIVSQFAYHLSPAALRALRDVPTVITMMDYKAICPTGTRLLPDGSRCTVLRGPACTRNRCIGHVHSIRDRARYARIEAEIAHARLVLCPSSSMQREFQASGIDATLVPLAVRMSTRLAGRPAVDPVFAYVGRLSREKGVAILIAAFAQILRDYPSAKLRLIGDGALMSNLRALTGVLGVSSSVTFCGWSDSDAMHANLDDAWCVVCPSLWAEPFGLAAIEAVSLGIPVIASDSGGFCDTIDESTGIFAGTGDVGSLASAMRSIVRGDRFPGSRLPREVVDHFRSSYGIDEHARRVRGILGEMVGQSA